MIKNKVFDSRSRVHLHECIFRAKSRQSRRHVWLTSYMTTTKSKTELTASVLKKKKKIQTPQEIKRTLYSDETGQNMLIFEEVLFFSIVPPASYTQVTQDKLN